MKIYIAASFEQREEVKEAHERVIAAGYQITLDWTTHKSLKSSPKTNKLYEDYATSDVKGVIDADAYILLLGPRASTGAHIELGVAIGSNKKYIIIVGDIQEFTLFYKHPKIIHMPTLDDAIKYLSKTNA